MDVRAAAVGGEEVVVVVPAVEQRRRKPKLRLSRLQGRQKKLFRGPL